MLVEQPGVGNQQKEGKEAQEDCQTVELFPCAGEVVWVFSWKGCFTLGSVFAHGMGFGGAYWVWQGGYLAYLNPFQNQEERMRMAEVCLHGV